MKHFVYILFSETANKYYIGETNNLERRISEHNMGKERTTKPNIPFILIYSEKFKTRKEARIREKYLKSGCGKEFLKSL